MKKKHSEPLTYLLLLSRSEHMALTLLLGEQLRKEPEMHWVNCSQSPPVTTTLSDLCLKVMMLDPEADLTKVPKFFTSDPKWINDTANQLMAAGYAIGSAHKRIAQLEARLKNQ